MMPKKIFILAGEASGDKLGAGLMAELQLMFKAPPQFFGVGGDYMHQLGLIELFPSEDIAVMGLAEVLPKLNFLRQRINKCVDWICDEKPDLVLTIDSPDFSFRVQKAVHRRMRSSHHKPVQIHYIAPSVWAWRPGRAKKIAKFLDHLLCVLPFEPSYFKPHGLPATFVGHPITQTSGNLLNQRLKQSRDKQNVDIFQLYQLPKDVKIFALLPGSRSIELQFLLPIFLETVEIVRKSQPDLHVMIPTFEHLRDKVEEYFGDLPNCTIVTDAIERQEVIQHASVALAASGTVSLELAAAETPMVIAYKMTTLTYNILKMLIKVKYASIINIAADEKIIPEYIQSNCHPEPMAAKLLEYLNDVDLSALVVGRYAKEIAKLKPPTHERSSAACAADVVYKYLGE